MGSDLLDILNTNVKALTEVCPSLVTTSNQPGGLGLTLDISLDITDDDLLSYQTAYFNKVEEGNTYLSELQEIESQYFLAKYGSDIYNYFKTQRSIYIDNKINVSSSGSMDFTTMMSDISYEYSIYTKVAQSGFEDQVDLFKTNMETITYDVNTMLNENDKNKRIMQYRNVISNDVNNLSFKVSVFYYFILLCLFIYLYVNDILFLNKNKILYIIVILFPFLYQYIFKFIVYVYNKVVSMILNTSPKNAFLNDNTNPTFLDDSY
tara:strand:- start:5984 stop:6775 length:792 start_codon:yes stop_codon:yes gene_type:complete